MAELAEASLLSARVAFWTTVVCVPLALASATYMYGRSWRWLEALFLVPLVLSPSVSGFLILWFLSPTHMLGSSLAKLWGQLVFTPKGTILACLVVSFPLAFQACKIGRARVSVELEECGQVLGAPPVLRLLTVVWPQMIDAVVVACILTAARSLGEFGASFMVGGNIASETQTLPLLIYSAVERQDFGLAGWGALLSTVLGGTLYLGLCLVGRSQTGMGSGLRK